MHCFTDEQFTNICRVLNELSLGNLNYRLEYTDEGDDYEMLVTYLNLIGEMGMLYLSELLSHNEEIEVFAEINLHLDQNFTVKSNSESLSTILNKTPEELKGKPFEKLITLESLKAWSNIKRNLTYYNMPSSGCRIFFKVNSSIHYDCFCYFSRLPDNSIYISTHKAKTHTLKAVMGRLGIAPPNQEHREKGKPIPHLSEEDRIKVLMLEIILYFEQHLDGSLPDMKTITRYFGINEKKFKQSFKKYFNQTPYAFYIDKKLDRAMELLKTSHMSIEEVAYSVGYNTKSGFNEAFKKKFGMTPGKVKKKE